MNTASLIGLLTIVITTLHLALSIPVVFSQMRQQIVPIVLLRIIQVTKMIAITGWLLYAVYISNVIIQVGMGIALISAFFTTLSYFKRKTVP